MSRERTLSWLATLQADLSAVVRAPLDVRDGTRRPNPARYPKRACAAVTPSSQLTAAERLAVYNRQYWLRLLRATQEALPLTCRLVGAWHFNSIATRFLLAHPPSGHDLGAVADRFDHFLEEALRDDVRLGPSYANRVVPRAALLEAARLDQAFRRSFAAPPQPSFRPDAALAPDARLLFSPVLTLIREHWPLVKLREGVLATDVETPLPLPAKHEDPRTWAIFRTPRGTGQLSLEPGHARLLELLAKDTLTSALVRLEQEWPPQQHEALPAKVRSWLATSTRLGFFTGCAASR